MLPHKNFCDYNKEQQFNYVCKYLECKKNRLICCLECAKKDHEDHLLQLNEKNRFKLILIQSRQDCKKYLSTLRSQMEKIQNSFEQFCARILERYSIEDGEFFRLQNEEIGQVIKDLDSFQQFTKELEANLNFESFQDKINQFSKDLKLNSFKRKYKNYQLDKQENYIDIQSVQQQNKTETFILDNYVQQKFTGFSFQNEILQINPLQTQLLIKDNKFNHFLYDHSQQITQIKMTQQFMQKYNMIQLLSKERGEEINKLQFEQEQLNKQMEILDQKYKKEINKLQFEQVLLNEQMENMNQKSKEEINKLQFEQVLLNEQMENMKQKQQEEKNQFLTKQEQLKKQMENVNQESMNVRTQYYKLYDEKTKIQYDYKKLSKEYEQNLAQQLKERENAWISSLLIGGIGLLLGRPLVG